VSDPLLTLLKWCLLALLYLFFFRVLQATWAEVRAPRTADRATARREGRTPTLTRRRTAGLRRLRVVEPPELAGRTYELGQEITLGRAAGCHITLDDTYVSQLHARVSARDGTVYVEDLGSTNGTYLNRQRVTSAVVATPGDRLQVGGTVLEFQ
jgi:pSer/pThr/pTyr-binding forkhead associated (FHA) protein